MLSWLNGRQKDVFRKNRGLSAFVPIFLSPIFLSTVAARLPDTRRAWVTALATIQAPRSESQTAPPTPPPLNARLKTAAPPIQPVKPTLRLLWTTRPMVNGPPLPSFGGADAGSDEMSVL